ncbi:MAG TPA: cell division protein FtsZ [Candidatus Binatia bacterium]|nr:cell division protein FtsZ [Candidatus Binatia bacterium]
MLGSRITFNDDGTCPARITVVGVGGGGGNAVSRMIDAGLQGVKFVTINTDVQALWSNRALNKLQIGEKLTNGLGAGANPDVGKRAATDDTERICEALDGSDMVFITTGLGGGTGTGAAPVVASIANRLGGENHHVLTVAVVTLPFSLEGKKRMEQARAGLAELKKYADSVIAIPNDRVLQSVPRNTPVHEAFSVADDVLLQAVQGITDIIQMPGQINVDFADVRSVMRNSGHAVMGIGMGEGPLRALTAAQRAVSNPLLENASMKGANSVVVNITGGADLSLAETSEATSFITRVADPEANVIYGIVTNETLRNAVRVTVIATGFEKPEPQNGDGATRLGPLAAGAQNGTAVDGKKTGTDGAPRRGFVRRMFGRRAKKA